MKYGDRIADTPIVVANLLNDYFYSVFTNDVMNTFPKMKEDL